MTAQTPDLLRQVVSTTGEKLWVANYVWDTNALDWVAMTQPGSSAGGGGAATIADGADVTQGAKADAAWDGSSSAPTAQSILKYLGAKLEAVRALLAGTLTIGGAVSVSNFPATQAVSGPVTDTQLRASAVPVSGTFFQATQPVSAAALPLPSGAATSAAQTTGNTSVASIDTKTPALASGRVPVDGSGVTQPVSGTVTVNDLANAAATAKGTQGTKGVPTQDLKDAGRTYVVITLDAVAGITAEALATMAINKGGTTSSATTYTVTAGKTLRLLFFGSSTKNTSTVATNSRARVRSAASVLATSPIIAANECGTAAAVANCSATDDSPFPEGIEIAAGQQIGISHIESATTSTVSCCLVGYEY